MGYTLKIGEAVLDWSVEGVGVDCESVTLPEAPACGDPTDHTNERWPSYSVWANAMRTLGLMDVMFSERNKGKGHFEWNGETRYPLLDRHPGVAPITKEHVEYVAAALDRYKSQHPDHIAQYPPLKPGVQPSMINSEEDFVDDPRFDSALVRGEWLLWWLRWAVENCKRPVFVNT